MIHPGLYKNHPICSPQANISSHPRAPNHNKPPCVSFIIATMIGKIYVKTSSQLRRIETNIIDLVENHLHVHILNENHECGENRTGLDIFITNQHPSIKCVFSSKKMLAEFHILSVVLEGQFGTGLHTFCPICGKPTI